MTCPLRLLRSMLGFAKGFARANPFAKAATDPADGTAAMTARLVEIDRTANPATNPYLNDRRVALFRAKLRPDMPKAELAATRSQLGLNLLQAN